jgi:DNA-binding LytR/AlgR family response regulator
MRTLIVDDEPLALRRLEILLSRRPRIEVVGTCRNGRDALALIESIKPDLVLLDIRMPEMTGLEVATALTAPDAPAVIFVTAYDAFAVQAFEAAAVDYLLKPVESERLDQALARARQQYAMRDAESRAGELEAVVNALRYEGAPAGNDLWVKDRNGTVRLSKHEMDWVEAEGDYVRIHCGERSWLHRETMTAMENMLDDRFFVRVHRSAIVNSRRVTRTGTTRSGGQVLHLETGAEVRIGRSYESAVKRALGRIEA